MKSFRTYSIITNLLFIVLSHVVLNANNLKAAKDKQPPVISNLFLISGQIGFSLNNAPSQYNVPSITKDIASRVRIISSNNPIISVN
jgi:hypothetical protein